MAGKTGWAVGIVLPNGCFGMTGKTGKTSQRSRDVDAHNHPFPPFWGLILASYSSAAASA
jgi:hypothetical protein